MTPDARYWVNVDRPTSTLTVHERGCRYVRAMQETPLKGIGELRHDGGWIACDSLAAVTTLVQRTQREQPVTRVKSCKVCASPPGTASRGADVSS